MKEDFKERAQNAQSNSEDAKKAQEEDYKDFDGTMQIFNQDKAVCGQMKFRYKFPNDSADQKNDEELWGGRPSEVLKDKTVIMLKLEKMEKSEKFEYEDEQNDYDKSHEIEVAEADEMQQPNLRARALFTLDENYKEDMIKEVEDLDDVTRSLDGSNRGPDPGQTSKAKAVEAMKGRKFGYSGEEVSRHSLVGKLTTRTNEIYGADTTAEKMLKLNKVEELRVKDFALAHVTNLEQPCKRQDFQGMVERTVIDSTIEATSTAAMHDPTSIQEQEIEWPEPDAIELAQRHAKLEGKREYEASRDDGISYYSGGAEDRFYPGGVMKLNICTPMHSPLVWKTRNIFCNVTVKTYIRLRCSVGEQRPFTWFAAN